MAIGLAANAISLSLHPHLKSSPLFLSSSSSSLESNSCYVALRSRRSLPSGSSCPGRIPTIRSAETKPAKSPADEDWKTKREVLLQKKVRSMDAKEALRLQLENNFIILDVRPEAELKEAIPPGAINIQSYKLIKEWTARDITRRAAFAFFGIVAGTEKNPDFMQNIYSRNSA